ncbi:peptide chain release factor 1 [Diaporthe helianthi]|uniref:Peptide chain release factor 1 n=1 Tax=Diaporthe helianthi TaxID=158607 RepID=A0A2P5HXE2_DIAHE|nr:peptide chain release factor 1 [Diaporthe helianthi]
MLAASWVSLRCLRSQTPSISRQFLRRASTDSPYTLPNVLLERARKLAVEHGHLTQQLADSFDSKIAKRAGEIAGVASALKEWEAAQSSLSELRGLLQAKDAEIRDMAQDELNSTHEQLGTLGHKLSASLTPRDPYADLPCILEFRPGPGGVEGRFFTDSLFKMYQLYCQRKGLRAKVVKYDTAEGAGDVKGSDGELPLQEAVLEIHDMGAYDLFRTEAGIHRVQRVPVTESKGRTHTSAVAVWVLPSFPESGAGAADYNSPESDFYIDPGEVRTETMRARGAGGQHVNKTESAIRLTHTPTGIQVSMQDQRSQQANRDTAWKILRSRIAIARREAREEEAKSLRDSVLSKDKITRGDKIRTYNYSQDRCSDHRSGLDVNNLPDVLAGGRTFDRILESVKEWRLARDIEAVIEEEEVAVALEAKKLPKKK